ncbi:DUF6348 family protein [Lysobacter sp. CA199]|uniref:DUF6348 family protein n=1 Tax=Lysobacter sp. CA199 TaxID=3455608 RepID=UPI003F8D2D62
MSEAVSQADATQSFEPLPGNPGSDTHGHLRFHDETGEEWFEPFDLPELAATVLSELGHAARVREDGWLELSDSQWRLLPQFIEFHEREDGNIGTATTVQCNHPRLSPQGLFEYQYAIHETFDEAAGAGFRKWARTDLPVLLDAERDEPEACMTMSLELPDEDGQPARKRRLLFGPIEHYGRPESESDLTVQDDAEDNAKEEADHDAEAEDFCPCCLFTKSIDAFEPLLRTDRMYGLRLFASIDHANGACQADCRVDGEEWEQGLDALRAYAATWPAGAGLEYRKQYVLVQNAPG